MNESKQEPEVPSNETSGKEVRESYILCSNLPRLVCIQSKFAPKDISSDKFRLDIETDFIRPGKSEKLYNYFEASAFPDLMERDRNCFHS